MVLLFILLVIPIICSVALVFFLLSLRRKSTSPQPLGPLILPPAPTAPTPSPTAPTPTAPTPTAPTPSPTTAPTAPTVSTQSWAAYKNRLPGEDVNSWSYRIYNAITSNAAANEDRYTGGINYNVEKCGLSQRSSLTKTMADCYCRNPCYWFGANTAQSGMCDCGADANGAKAINF